jgi:NADPH:quinone reductase-like Zn-dependent oxidoreductase
MKAIVYTTYGTPDVLRVQEVAKPAPKDDEILVRVHANSVNFGDLIARNFGAVTPQSFFMPSLFWLMARLSFGWNKPKNPILGNEFAGTVEAVGSAVKRFKVGDAVFGYRGQNMGANAEYICVKAEGMVTHKPARLTFEEAATVPGGALTALSLLRKVKIQRGQRVLINGASGSIGAAALQLAKQDGAHVTAVCGTPRMEMVRQLGADQVIDYTQQDFTTNGEKYDLIIDTLGKSSFDRCKESLTENGVYLLVSFKFKQVRQMLWTARFSRKKVICALSDETPADLERIRELVEAGKIKAVVDRCYPMEQAADAHRYAESGHKHGSVVISMI